MPKLANSKWETFCHGLADGLKAIDAHERAGYARSASASSQLKNQPQIQERVAELIQQKADIAIANGDDIDNLPSDLDRDWLVKTLMTNVKLAQDARQIAPANKAVEMLALLIGLSFKTPNPPKEGEPGAPADGGGFDMDKMAAGLAMIGSITKKADNEETEGEGE